MKARNTASTQSDFSERFKRLSPVKRELLMRSLRNVIMDDTVATLMPRSEKSIPVLSFAQRRLWFLEQLQPGNPASNVSAVVRLKGSLAIPILAQTFDAIISRHGALRTTYISKQGEPIQIIASPSASLSLPYVELLKDSEEQSIDKALQLALEEARKPFDLTRGPLIRIKLVKLNSEDHIFIIAMHHITTDDWSLGVLIREVAVIYEALSRGMTPSLPDLPIQYTDFAYWQRMWLESGALDGQLTYWKTRLSEPFPVLKLPTDRPRQEKVTPDGSKRSLTLSEALSRRLRELSRQTDVTLFMTLFAAFNALLYCYTGQEDIVIGVPVANRNRQELEVLVGYFVNALVLRTDLTGDPTFRQLLGRIRQVTLEAYANQDFPFDKLVEVLWKKRGADYSPFFNTVFNFLNAPMPPLKLSGLELSLLETHIGIAKYDLTVYVSEYQDRICVSLVYRTALFNGSSILRMLDYFVALLETASEDTSIRLSALKWKFSQEEERVRSQEEQESKSVNRASLSIVKRKNVNISE